MKRIMTAYPTHLPGHRAANAREVVHIDYADVLRQAVDNERHNVLRQVRAAVLAVPTVDRTRGDSWSHPKRDVAEVRQDIISAIDRIMDGTAS